MPPLRLTLLSASRDTLNALFLLLELDVLQFLGFLFCPLLLLTLPDIAAISLPSLQKLLSADTCPKGAIYPELFFLARCCVL